MKILKSLIVSLVLAGAVSTRAADMDRKIFDKAIDTLQSNTHYEITEAELYRGALQGVMQVLEEKNTQAPDQQEPGEELEWMARNVLLNPAQVEDLDINTRGTFAGVGISLKYEPDEGILMPVIIEVLDGGGKKAGLQAQDQLLKINGKPIEEFENLTGMVNAIRGPAGTSVQLTLLRNSEVLDFNVNRETIRMPNVQSEILSGEVAYLKLHNFNETAVADIRQCLIDLTNDGVSKLILDLRDNVGGLYEPGSEIMAFFMRKNEILFQEQRKVNGKMKPYLADQDGVAANMRVIVLVSEKTASVAEAMALMFKHRADSVVMGTPTFGKASIESLFDISDGYKVLLTVGMLYDRDGKTWHGEGITPDIAVPRLEGETDNVLELAQDYIRRM